jgi:hypothetical protein
MSGANNMMLGTLGQPWRAYVDGNGDVCHLDGSLLLRWCIGIEDRWLQPSNNTRHRQVDGLPISESRVRAAGGDVVVTVFMAADAGGALVVEVSNESGAPVAFGVNRSDVVSSRAPSALPSDAPFAGCAVAVTHSTTSRVAVAMGNGATTLMSTSEQVARGWTAQLDLDERWDLPDPSVAVRQRSSRCHVLLAPLADDAALRALTLSELDIMSPLDDDAVVEVAASLERLARGAKRNPLSTIETLAVSAGAAMLRRHGEHRAANDATNMVRSIGDAKAPSVAAPPSDDDAHWLAHARVQLAVRSEQSVALFAAVPTAWFGQPFAIYGVPVDGATVSAAVRWHGARPALLWDIETSVRGATGLTVTCPGLDPTWSSSELKGEALLAAPRNATEAMNGDTADAGSATNESAVNDGSLHAAPMAIPDDPGSFS